MKLLEKFITMGRIKNFCDKPIFASLYINPTDTEMRTVIPEGARGFITASGDLYIEGYEREIEYNGLTMIHYDLIQFIKTFIPKVPITDKNEVEITKDGFTVQRAYNSNLFGIAESIHRDSYHNNKDFIQQVAKKFEATNKSLELFGRITEAKVEVKYRNSTMNKNKYSFTEDTMTQTGTMFNRTMTGAEGLDGASSIAQPDAAQRSKDLQTKLQTSAASQGIRDPQMINQAWDLAKQKADQSLIQGSKDPNYWDYVNASAATSLGVDSSQRTESLASIPGYVSFEEEVERVEHQGSGKRDKDLAAKTKEEAAKELIKKLKKSDASLNAIVHSVMNRYAVDITTAMEWCKAKPEDTKHSSKSDPLDFSERATTDTSVVAPDVTEPIENAELQEKRLGEDNFYNHARVQRQQTEFDYSAISTRDAFEWEMSSTNLRARAIIIDRNFSFEVVIKTMTEYMPRWPHIFDSLKKVGINSVLQISINQLNATSNQLRVTPDDCDINSSSYDAVLKTMDSVMKSYRKIWGDSHYQVCIISTKNPDKMLFLGKLVDVLQKSIGLKFNEKLSSILAEAVLAQPGSADQKVYLVLANPKGAKFKEGVNPYEDEQMSRDYASLPKDIINIGDTVNMVLIPYGGIETVAKEIINKRIPGVVEDRGTEYGRWWYTVKFQNGSIYRCHRSDIATVEKVNEETSSDSFSAAPENMIRLVSLLPRDKDFEYSKGSTGEEITKQSKKHLDAMTSSGFGTQLESVKDIKESYYVNPKEVEAKLNQDISDFSSIYPDTANNAKNAIPILIQKAQKDLQRAIDIRNASSNESERKALKAKIDFYKGYIEIAKKKVLKEASSPEEYNKKSALADQQKKYEPKELADIGFDADDFLNYHKTGHIERGYPTQDKEEWWEVQDQPENLTKDISDKFHLCRDGNRYIVIPKGQSYGKPYNGIWDTPEEAWKHALELYNFTQNKDKLFDSSNFSEVVDTIKSKDGRSFEIRRKKGELLYPAHDENGEIKRTPDGNAIYLTPQELIDKKLPYKDTTLGLFDGSKIIGWASDEFGADGIWIRPSYRNNGLGIQLLRSFRKQFPGGRRKMGQMTSRGSSMAKSYFNKYSKEESRKTFSSLIALVEKTKISKDYKELIKGLDNYSNSDINDIRILYRGDPDFIEMLGYIALIGNPGHSFSITVDSDYKDNAKNFSFDGDGVDYIKDIRLDKPIPSKKSSMKDAITENRMYYLRCPDGHVEAFDNKEKRDQYKDQVKGKSTKAYDFFNDLTDDSTMFGTKNKVDIKGVKTPVIALSHKEEKADYSKGLASLDKPRFEVSSELNKLKESKFEWYDLSDEEKDDLFAEFKSSYEKAVGAAWDRDLFERRANGWNFYGTIKGGVAVRPQQSGLLKLNACYGDLRNIILGFEELVSQNKDKGIWGFVTADILKHITRMSHGEFKQLPASVAKLMIPKIAPKLGAEVNSVNADGSIQVDTVAGTMTKYFVANKEYYRWLLTMAEDSRYASQFPVPQTIIKPVVHLIKALI